MLICAPLGFGFVRHLPMNVRPEFLYYDCDCVQADLRSPDVARVHQGPIGTDEFVWIARSADVRTFGMVTVRGNRCRGCAPKNLGVIELRVPGIASSHKNSTDGVSRAPSKTAVTGLIKPRILMQHRRENGAHREILDGAIGRRRAIALSIRRPPLSKCRFAVVCLADCRKPPPPRELNRIERPQRHDFEFLFRAKWRQLLTVL